MLSYATSCVKALLAKMEVIIINQLIIAPGSSSTENPKGPRYNLTGQFLDVHGGMFMVGYHKEIPLERRLRPWTLHPTEFLLSIAGWSTGTTMKIPSEGAQHVAPRV